MSTGYTATSAKKKKKHHRSGGAPDPNSLAKAIASTKKSKKGGKRSGYIQPIGSNDIVHVGREDQGQDYQTRVGTHIRAIGDARVVYVSHSGTRGFGGYVVYQLTTGKEAGTYIYVGHAAPDVHVGQHIRAGQAVATTVRAGTLNGSNASADGWVEIGVATASGNPKYSGKSTGGGSTDGGAAFRSIIGQGGSYSDRGANSANQGAANATAKANSQAYQQATTQEQIARKEAQQSAHVSDPWVTVMRNKKGQIIGLGEAYGQHPPKNALKYGGQAVTKSDFSYIWSSKYATIYEEYTGKVANAAEEVRIIHLGLTTYGLQQFLSKQPGFEHSPVFKQQKGGINNEAMKILGTNAPDKILRQAVAEGWDQATLDNHLRRLPAYTNGPEFKSNYAQMLNVYESIYGKPDAKAQQALKEAAGAQWSPDQMAAYLRAQPEYKTSKEYQNNAVSFLDSLGGMFGTTATLKPGAPPGATGGDAVQNSPYVPGKPGPLDNGGLDFHLGLNTGTGSVESQTDHNHPDQPDQQPQQPQQQPPTSEPPTPVPLINDDPRLTSRTKRIAS